MMSNKKMEELLRSMYDAYGFTDKSGMSYFSGYRAQLSEFDSISLVVVQMRSYPHRYVFDFLLACPFIWTGLRSQGWKELMRRASPRPDPKDCREELSEFCDIEFLQRILRVDGLRTFLEDTSVSRKDKEYAEEYFRRFPRLMLVDPEELVDLDGSYFVSVDEVDSVRSAMLHEHEFMPIL